MSEKTHVTSVMFLLNILSSTQPVVKKERTDKFSFGHIDVGT